MGTRNYGINGSVEIPIDGTRTGSISSSPAGSAALFRSSLPMARTSPLTHRDHSIFHQQHTAMKKTTGQWVKYFNDFNLVQYLQILGFTPTASRPDATDFYTPFGRDATVILTIHHDSNTFSDPVNHRQGHLVDLIVQLYGATPKEIIQDIMPYRLDILMQSTKPDKTARP
jgi:hypothetical protein